MAKNFKKRKTEQKSTTNPFRTLLLLLTTLAIISNTDQTLSLLTQAHKATKLDWQKSSLLYLQYNKTTSGVAYLQGEYTFTYNQTSGIGQAIKVSPLFASNVLLVPSKEVFGFGIECFSNNSNHCQLNPQQFNITLNGTQLTYQYAETVSDLGSGLNTSSLENGLRVAVVTKKPAGGWPIGKFGVLGLAPSSQLFEYVKNSFDLGENAAGYFNFSQVVYSAEKLDVLDSEVKTSKTGVFDNSQMYLNGLNVEKVNTSLGLNFFKNDPTEKNEFWGVKNVKINYGGEGVGQFQQACFAPEWDGSIFTTNEQKFESIKNAILGDLKGVTDEKAALAAAKDLNITWALNSTSNIVIRFRPAEYLKSVNGANSELVVNAATAAELANACDGADLIFGRLFFLRNYVVFSKGLEGEDTPDLIGITQYMPLDKITSQERLVLLGFGLLMVLLILIALVAKLFKKEGKDGRESVNRSSDGYVRES